MPFRSTHVILNSVISNLNPISGLCAAFFRQHLVALSGLGAHVESSATEIFSRPDARCEACKQLRAHSCLDFPDYFFLLRSEPSLVDTGKQDAFFFLLRQPIKRWHFATIRHALTAQKIQVPRASTQRWECGSCLACIIPFRQINRTKKKKEQNKERNICEQLFYKS